MLRMPWGARTPKRSAADSAADYLGVERRCVHTALSTIGCKDDSTLLNISASTRINAGANLHTSLFTNQEPRS